MSLFMDIGTGAGLAGATGVRPFLPPLLAGALARGDVGIDFDGTDWSFLESPAFLGAVLVLGLVAYGAGPLARRTPTGARRVDLALLVVGAVLGALLFAGALADGGHAVGDRPGGGPAVRAARRAGRGRPGPARPAPPRRRARPGSCSPSTRTWRRSLLAAVAVFVPPLSFVALIGFVVLLLGSRRREGEKYAGLRVLR